MLRLALTIAACTTLAPLAPAADEPAGPASLSFGAPKAGAVPPGFGPVTRSRQAGAGDSRDRRYANGLFSKYDTNRDRVLQEDEWRQIRGNPERADADGDGRITFDELVSRVSRRRAERATERLNEAIKSKAEEGRRSQRLSSPADRLPDGLPGWFRDRDQNGDGQVAMHEYSRSWSDSTAGRFARLDTNDDGLISPNEAKR